MSLFKYLSDYPYMDVYKLVFNFRLPYFIAIGIIDRWPLGYNIIYITHINIKVR